MKNLNSKNVKLKADEARKVKGGKPIDTPACFMNYDMVPVMDCNQCPYYRNPCFPIW